MKTNKINVVLSLNKTKLLSNVINEFATEERSINNSNNVIRGNGVATTYNTGITTMLMKFDWVDDNDNSVGHNAGSGFGA